MPGDGRYLAIAGLLSTIAYLPAALAVVATGAGIGWLWGAYGVWMLAGAVTLLHRARGRAWLRIGAVVSDPAPSAGGLTG